MLGWKQSEPWHSQSAEGGYSRTAVPIPDMQQGGKEMLRWQGPKHTTILPPGERRQHTVGGSGKKRSAVTHHKKKLYNKYKIIIIKKCSSTHAPKSSPNQATFFLKRRFQQDMQSGRNFGSKKMGGFIGITGLGGGVTKNTSIAPVSGERGLT